MTGNWRAQVAEETACEAAAYGRQARREGNSIDAHAEYGDGFCDEEYFRDAWLREDQWIRDQQPAVDMAKAMLGAITGKAAAE